ncbi:site-specific integrase [Cryobacterium sp. MDB1-18-2]|nr:site-specific integrase [Cryobacterium sp. MDB2-A-1]TFC12280.1 site-specific integrase [Cryobacterium sp. MDB2-A-2]TFC19889.1 site-specific integrase [Cryobacterium sp. MDB2-10]TFC30818.1 site-specific integrase [Cryobacterium sp. MDB1-18-2]TFC38161.1 site-specific integrase [Cryobacterium sp. MDB1-18-1]
MISTSVGRGVANVGSVTSYTTASGKKYRVQYRKPDHSSTTRRGFSTKKEATLFLASVEVSKSRGSYVDPTRSRVTVAEWMDRWLATRSDLRPSTIDRAQGIIRRNIAPDLGGIPLGDLERMTVQEWASRLSETQAPWSVRKIVNTLGGALQMAVDDGRITTNPAARLKLPKVSKVSKTYLTHEQVHDLEEAVEGRGVGYGLVVLVLSYCGLRWGELAGLTVADVDVKRGRLEVRHTMIEINGYLEESTPKDYEERSIPVPAFILLRLEQAIADRKPGDHVFVGQRGGGVLRNRIFRRGFLTAAAAEIGVPGLTPHELRHTCASLAVSAGANVKALQRMLGHASAKETLDTYADLFDSDLDSVAVALNQVAVKVIEVKSKSNDDLENLGTETD